MSRRLSVTVLLAALTIASAARGHEIRPAYLEVTETVHERYAILWRTPVLSGMRLPVVLRLPDGVRELHDPIVQTLTDSLLERRTIAADRAGLVGRRIEFVGLQATITDVLVRVALLDGTRSTTLVRPSQPWVEVAAAQGPLAVLRAYLVHGVEHILFGFDHLLFVLALVLIVPTRRTLLATITAFTLAHSVTLALATLGIVHVPAPPVEAAIALSIVLLASEIVHRDRGTIGLTARRPWIVAFVFGLLHGFGFAGALTQVGLPQGDLPLALLAFNVGVECGQLAFVAGVLGVSMIARRVALGVRIEQRTRRTAPYAIGALAAFWFFERLAGF